MKLVERARTVGARSRERSRLLDHAVRTVTHYADTQGNVLAGSITYFGFLSVFPLLVIGFAVVGFVTGGSQVATGEVTDALDSVFPGLFTGRQAMFDVADFRDAAGAASVLGSVALLYTGLNWVGSLRTTLQLEFTLPLEGMPGLLMGKVRDFAVLVLLGVVLVTSVSLSAVVTTVTDAVLDAVGVDALPGYQLLLRAVGVALGVAASTLLFFVMYRLLPQPDLPRRALLQGALVAALAFELLKLVATTLITIATGRPAAAVIGTVVVLVIWINLFSRVTLLGAAWAATSVPARRVLPELREEALGEAEEVGAYEPRRPPTALTGPPTVRGRHLPAGGGPTTVAAERPASTPWHLAAVLRRVAAAGVAAIIVRWVLRSGQR